MLQSKKVRKGSKVKTVAGTFSRSDDDHAAPNYQKICSANPIGWMISLNPSSV